MCILLVMALNGQLGPTTAFDAVLSSKVIMNGCSTIGMAAYGFILVSYHW